MPPTQRDSAVGERRDPRLEQLEQWLRSLFGTRDFAITPASADASFRRYFRVTRQGETWIAMDAPPDKEDMQPYIRVANMLVAAGVNAPKIVHSDGELGFLLNSDLGSQTYLAELARAARVDTLYQDAMTTLIVIQSRASVQASQLPAYDAALLQREMTLFPEWFCARHLQLHLDARANRELQRVFAALVVEALGQPRVFVHRDYHSRNLMVTAGRYGSNPGVLDFQDAVHGPITYDLVSLLRDCYISWPPERVYGWLRSFQAQARCASLAVGDDEQQFARWFDWMGVQRHLKAIGIFARLWHRDGKPGYLKDIPRTLDYVRNVAGRYEELAPLRQLIDAQILPALQRRAGTESHS